MSYHDRRLLVTRRAVAKSRSPFMKGIRKGFLSIALFPKPIKIELGSVEDDWLAVGDDIRIAMDRVAHCE
jgi:hypothetical protein